MELCKSILKLEKHRKVRFRDGFKLYILVNLKVIQ